jgi:hypothetical protein
VRQSASKRGTAGTHDPDKFRRYRARQKAKGMKLLRIWVPDPDAPGFADEARRQAALLRGDPHEAEVLEWIEQVADTTDWT